MLASEIITRARSLADIPNSEYIDHDDEVQSLWESYKDTYSKITDSSDDFYISTVTISTVGATKLGENEYELTIPDDIYKLRFVDYMYDGRWVNMEKFNTNQRNDVYIVPKYRWRGNKLWIVAGSLPASIRVDYYPSPVMPSIPKKPLTYLTGYQVYELININNKSITVVNGIDYLFYLYGTNDIYVESIAEDRTTKLYTDTGGDVSNLIYDSGYIYYLRGGNIRKSQTDFITGLQTTIADITALGTITSFNVVGSLIYYVVGTSTYRCDLSGGNQALVEAVVYYDTCQKTDPVYGNSLVYRDASGFIHDGVSTLSINCVTVSCDGKNIYYLTNGGDVKKLPEGYTNTLTTETLGYGIGLYGGQINSERLAVTGTGNTCQAISTYTDTDFIYPLNQANETLAYQCAIDFKRKANGDISQLAVRLADIYTRLEDQLKRDEYQPERRMSEYTRPINW